MAKGYPVCCCGSVDVVVSVSVLMDRWVFVVHGRLSDDTNADDDAAADR